MSGEGISFGCTQPGLPDGTGRIAYFAPNVGTGRRPAVGTWAGRTFGNTFFSKIAHHAGPQQPVKSLLPAQLPIGTRVYRRESLDVWNARRVKSGGYVAPGNGHHEALQSPKVHLHRPMAERYGDNASVAPHRSSVAQPLGHGAGRTLRQAATHVGESQSQVGGIGQLPVQEQRQAVGRHHVETAAGQ